METIDFYTWISLSYSVIHCLLFLVNFIQWKEKRKQHRRYRIEHAKAEIQIFDHTYHYLFITILILVSFIKNIYAIISFCNIDIIHIIMQSYYLILLYFFIYSLCTLRSLFTFKFQILASFLIKNICIFLRTMSIIMFLIFGIFSIKEDSKLFMLYSYTYLLVSYILVAILNSYLVVKSIGKPRNASKTKNTIQEISSMYQSYLKIVNVSSIFILFYIVYFVFRNFAHVENDIFETSRISDFLFFITNFVFTFILYRPLHIESSILFVFQSPAKNNNQIHRIQMQSLSYSHVEIATGFVISSNEPVTPLESVVHAVDIPSHILNSNSFDSRTLPNFIVYQTEDQLK